MKPKTVAIIGAGPAGLITAKTLIRSPSASYSVTIFDKKCEVGGLWAVHRSADRLYEGMLNPWMPTNLSRFNIGFSDLSWGSVPELSQSGDGSGSGKGGGHVEFWPRAWMVGGYLREFARRYVPADCFRFGTRVVGVDRLGEGKGWRVGWRECTSTGSNGASMNGEATTVNGPNVSEGGAVKEQRFDYVVVASGFFAQSMVPSNNAIRGSTPGKPDSIPVPTIHSCKLRFLSDIVPESHPDNAPGIILVVGGGMSGADAATVLASQLSDAKYSPPGTNDKALRYARLKVVQLCPDAAYALPLAASIEDPSKTAAPHFVPLDIKMYDLSARPPGDIQMGVGKWPKDVINGVHNAFKGLVGDQSDLGVAGLKYTEKLLEQATYVTLTELYSGYVRSGDIEIRKGRLQGWQEGINGKVDVAYSHSGSYEGAIGDVVGIVYATGFSPQEAIEYLDPEVLKKLSHDPEHNRLPLILSEHATMHKDVPGLAIVGWHEGAFWGSMEMEARLVERRWSATNSNSPDDSGYASPTTSPGHEPDKLIALRTSMKEREPDVPQYWLGDYTGLMEVLARETNTTRNNLDFGDRAGPVSIARYTDPTNDKTEAHKSIDEFYKIYHAGLSGQQFLGRASLLALQGNWKIKRTITSFLDSMPSGDLVGTGSWHPRNPTVEGYHFEFLYIEQGVFTMRNMTMNATRRYVWRYNEETDKISVWFVKDDGKTVDYLYHNLNFDLSTSGEEVEIRKVKGWLAEADHLCVEDMYSSNYRFKFRGANLGEVRVVHSVKGPRKDYVSETIYVR